MITLKQVTIGKMMKINRSSTNSREFTMEAFLEPGLVSYEDVGEGVSRLDKETIDKMLPSFIGCPLVIEHTDEPKEEVLNGKKDEKGNAIKVGQVTRAWWNAETGKYDCSFIADSDDAVKKINEGWSGSCAYGVRQPLGPGGELHAMRYDNTILNGEFDHLALVPNPRYEDCTIRMNGKPARIKENSTEKQAEFDKEKKEHPEFTDEQIWQIVEDHMKKENGKTDRIMKISSEILESHNKRSGRDLIQYRDEYLAKVRAAGITSLTQEEFEELENENYHTDIQILMEAGIIKKHNASSEQKAEVDAMLKRGASDETIMKRMKEKHGLSDEQTQKILDSLLFSENGKQNAGEYADVKVGQKIRALGGVEFKSEMTVSRITSSGDLYLKASDGTELGPFDLPLNPCKKNTVTVKMKNEKTVTLKNK